MWEHLFGFLPTVVEVDIMQGQATWSYTWKLRLIFILRPRKSDENKEEISLTEHVYPKPSMSQGLC